MIIQCQPKNALFWEEISELLIIINKYKLPLFSIVIGAL